MSEFNEISFPSHRGLPWATSPPLIDGFTDLQPGVPLSAWHLEAGYTGGARFSYPGGGGAAYPTASFQGVRDASGDFLYLAFDVRFDPTFDLDDRIIVMIQKSHSTASHSVDERRIDIQPLFSDSGAEPPDNAAYPPEVGYRDNRPAHFRRIYKRNPAPSATVPTWGDGSNNDADINSSLNMTKFDVKVTSSRPGTSKNWTVELRIPTKVGGTNGGGAGWMDLTANVGLYINMIRLCGSGTCGPTIPIGDFFATQFTWPFDPGNATAHVIADPAAGPLPSPAFWDIPPSAFGLAHLLDPSATNPSKGVKFQNSIYGIGVLSGGAIGGTLDMRAVGNVNTLVGRVINDHESNAAADVAATYRIAAFGIGGTAATWEMTPGPPSRPESGPNPAVASGPITATPSGSTPVPVDITSNWTITAGDRARFGTLWSDQCLWVSLDSSSGANIVESSVRRNLTVKLASTVDQTATISGDIEGGKPADGSDEHDYWLHTAVVRLEAASGQKPDDDIVVETDHVDLEGANVQELGYEGLSRRGAFKELNSNPLVTGELAQTDKPAATWLYVSIGYYRTSQVLTVNGKRHTIWMTSGSFGSIIHHYLEAGQSPSDVDISVELFGRDIQPTSDGGATFRVPVGSQKRLVVRVRAGTPDEIKEPLPPPEIPPDVDQPGGGPGGGGGSGGGCGLFVAMALAVIGVAVAVGRRLRR